MTVPATAEPPDAAEFTLVSSRLLFFGPDPRHAPWLEVPAGFSRLLLEFLGVSLFTRVKRRCHMVQLCG